MLKIDIDRAALSPSLIYRLFASMFIPFAYFSSTLKTIWYFGKKPVTKPWYKTNCQIRYSDTYGTCSDIVPYCQKIPQWTFRLKYMKKTNVGPLTFTNA